jgi:CRP-like cAMP-binding protein
MSGAIGKDVIKSCLKAVSLFADLSPANLDALAASARAVAYKKGARIFEEGAPADCCYVLISGKARVVLAGNSGTEILLHILTPPALVGEIALLDRSTRSASLVAADPCHLIWIPSSIFETLRQDPAFEHRLVAGLVATLRRADDRVRVITSFPSIRRVAWCLGRIARYTGRREGAVIVIPKPPHSELAEMAGCTRETVSRVLGILQRKKYISWDTQTMRIEIEGMQRYLTTELATPDMPART